MNGQLLDQKTGAALQAANIYASDQLGRPDGSNQGTTSDQDGRFTVDFPADFVTFRYLGYVSITLKNRSGFVIIEMLPEAFQLPPVTIRPPQPKKGLFVGLLGLLAFFAWDQSRPRNKRMLKL